MKAINPLLILVFTFSILAYSQGPKQIQITDYRLWSNLLNYDISSNEKWFYWNINYPNITDTLFIKNTDDNKIQAFRNSQLIAFDAQQKFALIQNDNAQTYYTNLEDRKVQILQGEDAKFIFDDQFIVTTNQAKKTISLFNRSSNQVSLTASLEELFVSAQKNILIWITSDNSIQIAQMIKDKLAIKTICQAGGLKRKRLTMNSQNSMLAFLEEDNESYGTLKSHRIHILDLQKLTNSTIDLKSFKEFEQYFIVDHLNYKSLQFNEQSNSLLFTIQKKTNKSVQTNQVQVWHANDTLEYPRKKILNPENIPILSSYNLKQEHINILSQPSSIQTIILNNSNFALQYYQNQFDSKYSRLGSSDIYILDIENQTKHLLVNRFPINNLSKNLSLSPNNQYLSYYWQDNWNIYNTSTQTTTKIPINKFDSFTAANQYKPDNSLLLDYAIWTTDNTLLLTGNQFYWLYNPKTSKIHKVVSRKHQNYTLTIKQFANHLKYSNNFYLTYQPIIDIKQGFYFTGINKNFYHSLFTYKNNQLTKILETPHKLVDVKKISPNSVLYRIQDSNLAPEIYLKNKKHNNRLLQTNTFQKDFTYPKKEIIYYTNSQGDSLKGLLLYPTVFNKDKKYPMITHVYEKQVNFEYQAYHIPTLYNPSGFNSINYTSNGYFVFFPDIAYEIGNVGKSAVDCVISAIKALEVNDYIDFNNLGLIGHSFGGYQVNFIATQTDIFHAIVSGAANFDIIFASLTLDNNNTYTNQTWRYLNYQMRMATSAQDNYLGYLNNSPIFFVNNINSNVLSWTGENDYSVNKQQSIAFHLAMRNLDKQHTLLIYPNDGHILTIPEHQKDLSNRIMSFFEKNLKK